MAIPDMNARKLQLPWDDAGILGDIDGYLKIPRDIALTAAWLFGIGPDKTHVLKTDINGNLLVGTTQQSGSVYKQTLVDANGNAIGSSNPLVSASYPVVLASLQNQTITTTTFSPTFDARPYATVIVLTVIAAISGAGASVQGYLDAQDPATSTWWVLNSGSTLTSVNVADSLGRLTPDKKAYLSPYITNVQWRPPSASARFTWLVAGTTPSITLSSYVIGY